MNIERLIGNRWLRGAAALLALISVGAAGLDMAGALPRWHGALRFAAWSGGFLALLAGVHWSQRIYGNWMNAAGAINAVMTTLLFGACYVLIVPAFWAVFQLRHPFRAKRGSDSHWHERRPVELDLQYFQRMG